MTARGESGASLMLALAFLMVVAVVTAALLGFATTSARLEASYDDQRVERYAGDAAIEAAIAWAADRPLVGIVGDDDEDCFLRSPATPPAPEVVTTCEANDGSGSAAENGLFPEYAILTTGQRHNEAPGYRGPNATPTYNGPTCGNPRPGDQTPPGGWPTGGDPMELAARGAARIEHGIRFSATPLESGDLNDPHPVDPCQTSSPVSRLLLTGNTLSGSGIDVEPGGEFDIVGGDVGSSVAARRTCNFVTVTCHANVDASDVDPMDPAATVEGHDPLTDAATASEWALPNVSGLPLRQVPSAGTCTQGGLVTLEPGYYDDVGEMNALFKNPACRTTTFWFRPNLGADGVLDDPDDPAPDDTRGTFYFDFKGSSTGGSCGRYDNVAGSVTNAHQWCVGESAALQRIVGGTPFNWSPGEWSANPLYKGTGNVEDDRGFPRQITPDDPGGDCDETKPGVEFVFGGDSHIYVADGSIELCAGPPDGNANPESRQRFAIYNVPALQPSRAASASAVAAPTGEPIDADQSTATLTDPDNALRLAEPSGGSDWTPDAIGVGRSTTINIPNTPCAIDNNGSTCPTRERYRAGAVQMSFGGVTIPAGTTIKRVLARATYNTTSATAAGGEVPTSTSVLVPDPKPLLSVGSCTGSSSEAFPTTPNAVAPTTKDAVFPTTTIANSGDMLAIKDVTHCFGSGVGGSFNATWIARETEVCTSYGCNGPWTNTLDGVEFVVEVQSTGGPTLTPASGCVAGWAPNVVDTNNDGTFEAVANGGANYWNVENTGDTTCALLKVDSRRYDDVNTANAACTAETVSHSGTGRPYYCGRASIKGTVYAPSAVLDIADQDVRYAIFNRGIVVRSLMLRGLQYSDPIPFANAPEVDTGAGPRDVTFVSCIRAEGREDDEVSLCDSAEGDRILTRARVRYEVDTNYPSEERARIPSVQWWRSQR